jgi:molybdopterin synthase catalytic subunit
MARAELVLEPQELLVDAPIPPSRIHEVITGWSDDSRIGGVVSFAGLVRADETPEGPVTAIEFTAHRSMATQSMRDLVERTAETYDTSFFRVFLQHALGRVEVGEAPVIIVVGAGHRPEAFGLCRDILETLKAEVPIYGKELTEGGGQQWKVNR